MQEDVVKMENTFDMEGLVQEPDKFKRSCIRIFAVLGVQSLVSGLLAWIDYSVASFSATLFTNGWLLYVGLGLYLILLSVFLLTSRLKDQPQNQVLLVIVVLSINILDLSASSMSPETCVYVFSYLFVSVLGLFVYSIMPYKQMNYIHSIGFVVISIILISVLFILSGLNSWLNLVIGSISGLSFALMLLLMISDLTLRYPTKYTDSTNCCLYLYLDMLVVPYIISKIKRHLS